MDFFSIFTGEHTGFTPILLHVNFKRRVVEYKGSSSDISCNKSEGYLTKYGIHLLKKSIKFESITIKSSSKELFFEHLSLEQSLLLFFLFADVTHEYIVAQPKKVSNLSMFNKIHYVRIPNKFDKLVSCVTLGLYCDLSISIMCRS